LCILGFKLEIIFQKLQGTVNKKLIDASAMYSVTAHVSAPLWSTGDDCEEELHSTDCRLTIDQEVAYSQ